MSKPHFFKEDELEQGDISKITRKATPFYQYNPGVIFAGWLNASQRHHAAKALEREGYRTKKHPYYPENLRWYVLSIYKANSPRNPTP